MTNFEKWKKEQCDYINDMDATDYIDHLEYNDEDLCDSCSMNINGKCTLTDEQREDDIDCYDGVRDWCYKEASV